jgi:hypothetical protein
MSYVNGVGLQSCCDRSLHWENIKTNFEVKQIQFGRIWKKEFEDCGMQIYYQDLHTKNWYVIMYLILYKILYEICTYTSNLCIK